MTSSKNLTKKLQDQYFVFTGRIPKITKKQAAEFVKAMGGETRTSVTQETTKLVCGHQTQLKKGDKISSKHKRAIELIKKGQSIEILNIEEFYELINFYEIMKFSKKTKG